MNQGRVMDECVGRTFIDMEDRFFNPKVAAMVEQQITPIELRCHPTKARPCIRKFLRSNEFYWATHATILVVRTSGL